MAVNGVKLLDLIDSSDAFVSELASPLVGVITWSQRDHLVHIPQPRDRNDKLLEFLTRKSVADFKKFTRVLSKYQPHLVPLLVTDGGETFLLCSRPSILIIITWYNMFIPKVLLPNRTFCFSFCCNNFTS